MKHITLLILAFCTGVSAYANTKNKAKTESAELLAIKPLTAQQQQAKTNEFASIEATTPSAEAPLPIKPIAATRITLVKGKSIELQFSEYAKPAGWTLIWDASDYVLDHNSVVLGDFEVALTSFVKSANESGSRLRATFFRGNKTVRIQEF